MSDRELELDDSEEATKEGLRRIAINFCKLSKNKKEQIAKIVDDLYTTEIRV